jgi:hypothetical protein
MAYISQETKKAILDSVKKLVKQHDSAIKVTASVRDCRKLRVRLKSDRLVSEQQAYNEAKQANSNWYWEPEHSQVLYFPDTLNPETLELYKQINNAIHTVGGYYNNSDSTTDYFDTAFYYDCVVA